MYAQTAIKQNILPRNYAHGIVMRGVQKCTPPCTCSDFSLRHRNVKNQERITNGSEIDPPYNTGKKDDFRYNDAFVVKEDTFRHSKWLSFMAERLKIAKNLLSEQGIIFISIDDNEQAALKLLCDEILGEHNYITSLIWQKKKGGSNDSRHVATEHEYILVYANDIDNLNNVFIEYDENYVSRYKEKDEVGKYFWDTFKRKSGKQYYPITCPDGTVLQYEENGEPISWLRSEARFLSDLKAGETRIIKVNGKWTVHFKQRQPKGYKPRSIITEYGTTSTGADQAKKFLILLINLAIQNHLHLLIS